MRYLITGCNGFVGAKFVDYINQRHPQVELCGIDIVPESQYSGMLKSYVCADLIDSSRLEEIVRAIRPDCILHLASFSSVSYSWRYPAESFRNNTNIFLTLVDVVRTVSPTTRILSVGSSEEYGAVTAAELPLSEAQYLRPASPYAVARVAQEQLSMTFHKAYGLPIICTRSFNHIGPGQSDQFVVSGIGRRFVEFALGLRQSVRFGNGEVIRDFLDVNDVVRAYHLLLQSGQPGEVYNICSGVGISIAEIIERFKKLTGLNPPEEVDESLLRPVENPIVVGSYEKIRSELGWEPQIDIDTSLRNVFNFWKQELEK